MTDKSELRKQIRERKKQLPEDERLRLSALILENLEKEKVFREARTVMAYYSLKDEVRTHEFLRKWCPEKKILLPVVQGDDILLKPFLNGEKMKTGLLNVMEPCGNEIFDHYGEIDLVIVPGVAFDRNGNRMGRGKGYYDRFLPKVPRAKKIGICFPFQLVNEVPHTELDVAMDRVISC